jgi:WD40 repeat protein
MAQKLDSERELVTCDAAGKLLVWDCDARDAVQQCDTLSAAAAAAAAHTRRLRCVTVSPSGRYTAVCGDDLSVKVSLVLRLQLCCLCMHVHKRVSACYA